MHLVRCFFILRVVAQATDRTDGILSWWLPRDISEMDSVLRGLQIFLLENEEVPARVELRSMQHRRPKI